MALSALTLAACGERQAAPEGNKAPAAAPAPTAPTIELTDLGLGQVCRAVLSVVHEQDVAAIAVDGVADRVVSLSWPAPVDGGRRTAECRVNGDVVVWRPTGLPQDSEERWMDGPSDPILRFAPKGEAFTVIVTRPDGSTSQTEVAVNVEEAR